MPQYIEFPKYNQYPSTLQIGFKSFEPKIVDGKKIMIILDTTGSMGEMINEKNEGTKISFAKDIINKIVEAYPFSVIDIMPFSEKPHSIVNVSSIPDPDGCTNFTPILDEVTKYIKSGSEYVTTIFVSDGQPSEPRIQALESIRRLGSYCREAGTNTISIAIGVEADGNACSLFTGNRGYNCFVKYRNDIAFSLVDIINGIKCKFTQISDGNWIPIEESGNYYYLSDDISIDSDPINPSIENVRKYISLIIQDEIRSPHYINIMALEEFIKTVAYKLSNDEEKKEIIEFFTKSLKIVKKIVNSIGLTPAVSVAAKQAYQIFSSPSAGI
jgi:hypothetical protein